MSSPRKYGQPIDYWLDLVRDRPAEKHMETIAWLKTEFGIGHGHANAVVSHVRQSG